MTEMRPPSSRRAGARRAGKGGRAARLLTGLIAAALTGALVLWPQQSAVAASVSAQLNRLYLRMANVGLSLDPLERTTAGIAPWLDCISLVGVDEVGDSDGAAGYDYDARDGTVPGWTSALALHTTTDRSADYSLLDFSTRDDCRSRLAPQESSFAEPPVAAITQAPPSFLRLTRTVKIKRLQEMAVALDRRLSDAGDAVAGFDEWASCASWLPVTEYGDPEGAFGYSQAEGPEHAQPYRSAISVDRSASDDPDYELLVFKGAELPFTTAECGADPGEETDRAPRLEFPAGEVPTPVRRTRVTQKVADEITSLGEKVDDLEEATQDLVEPVQDVELFDGCMYTIGVTSFGNADSGYAYTEGGEASRRSALAFDVGLQPPLYNLMVFPGEEPPQIECDEDAGGQGTGDE